MGLPFKDHIPGPKLRRGLHYGPYNDTKQRACPQAYIDIYRLPFNSPSSLERTLVINMSANPKPFNTLSGTMGTGPVPLALLLIVLQRVPQNKTQHRTDWGLLVTAVLSSQLITTHPETCPAKCSQGPHGALLVFPLKNLCALHILVKHFKKARPP